MYELFFSDVTLERLSGSKLRLRRAGGQGLGLTHRPDPWEWVRPANEWQLSFFEVED